MAAAHMEAPWHTVSGMNEGFPSYPQAQTKRTPIKGTVILKYIKDS